MSASDPTDDALAAIASILDHPPSHQDAGKTAIETLSATPELVEADGYCKTGPGPMAAIRLKWTVRREPDEAYYVDETIGENSTAVVSGPMTANDAIQFVNEQARDAQHRFAQLKSEMAGRRG